MAQSLVPATVIASNMCEDIGDSNETKKFRILKKIGLAYKEINLFLKPDVDVEGIILPADDYQFELPEGFIYETKIMVSVRGCWITLDLNKNLRQTNKKATDTQIITDCNAFANGTINPTNFYSFYNCWRNGNFIGELYGIDAGWHSDNWYNIKNGVLEITNQLVDMADEICIEYKSDGLKDAYRLIASELEKCVMNGAWALYYEHSNPNLSADFQAKYEKQWHMIKRMYSFRKPEYLAFLFHSHDKSSPR